MINKIEIDAAIKEMQMRSIKPPYWVEYIKDGIIHRERLNEMAAKADAIVRPPA